MLSSIKKLITFLYLVNFYRRFISHAAERLMPLTDLLRGNSRKLVLTDAARVALLEIKSATATTTLLTHPNRPPCLVLR